MTEKSSRHDTIALEIYYSISVLLLQFVNENHFQETIAFHVGMYKLTRADAHESWIEAAEYLTQVSKAVFLLLEEKEDKLANHALNRVVNYIDGHLDEELSLTALAEIGGFNSSYLSRLFKQVQNETIGDYILHKRLELAKKLLSDTDVKIQDISVKCGYISPHSFTRAFRNEVGISPTEYREIELDKRSQIM
jgi:two-component system response regulator YesN